MVFEKNRAVLLALTPASAYELSTRLGAGVQQGALYTPRLQDVTYALGASLLMRNVTNRADLATFAIDITRAYYVVQGAYQLPWLGDWPVRTHIKAYNSWQDYPAYLFDGRSIFSMKKVGAACALQQESNFLNGTLTMGIDAIRLIPAHLCTHAVALPEIVHGLCLDPLWLNGWIPYVFVEPTATWVWTDPELADGPVPTTTWGIRAFLPCTRALRDACLIKCAFEQSLFLPLGFALGAIHLGVGHIFAKNFHQIPPFERFFLGGAYSVRGFQKDACPPRKNYNDAAGKTHWIPVGAQSMAQINVELRAPITSTVEGVVFQDLGVLTQNCGDFETSIVAATGFGLRYNTPMGPLRFDVGFNWPRNPDYPAYAWFLSLGHAF